MKKLLPLLMLAGCVSEPLTTPEGCPIYMTEIMQAQTQACQSAYHEEMARQRGATVTTCRPAGNGSVTCISG